MKNGIAIIGAGNIGLAIANGLVASGHIDASKLFLTRRHIESLNEYTQRGFNVSSSNEEALKHSELVFMCVEPRHVDGLLIELNPLLVPGRHILVSVVSGLKLAHIRSGLQPEQTVIRAMPNTATGIRESMTCIAGDPPDSPEMKRIIALFELLGECLVIEEEKMASATALAACGIAFFLRMIRAASQGGIEIGFHPETALLMAAQTARGAASLLLDGKNHPEFEIDRVTTPRGCTISGLNRMEHEGLSSAIIKGIVTSSQKASGLYEPGSCDF